MRGALHTYASVRVCLKGQVSQSFYCTLRRLRALPALMRMQCRRECETDEFPVALFWNHVRQEDGEGSDHVREEGGEPSRRGPRTARKAQHQGERRRRRGLLGSQGEGSLQLACNLRSTAA